jgi:hypothetical protein
LTANVNSLSKDDDDDDDSDDDSCTGDSLRKKNASMIKNDENVDCNSCNDNDKSSSLSSSSSASHSKST